MENHRFDPDNFFKTACFFEGSLVVVALILGWITDIDPFANLFFSEAGMRDGLLDTLPLLIIFFVMQELPYLPLQQIRELLQKSLAKSLQRKHWPDFFVLACIAGFSEEALFRGFLQPWLEQSWNMTAGLITSNLIFALVHAITPLYALLAFLIGLYLSIFLDYHGERNLLIPIIIHTLYDFVIFIVIVQNYRNRL
jgi:membrane protease YdiL (CAAX protease family)